MLILKSKTACERRNECVSILTKDSCPPKGIDTACNQMHKIRDEKHPEACIEGAPVKPYTEFALIFKAS